VLGNLPGETSGNSNLSNQTARSIVYQKIWFGGDGDAIAITQSVDIVFCARLFRQSLGRSGAPIIAEEEVIALAGGPCKSPLPRLNRLCQTGMEFPKTADEADDSYRVTRAVGLS
jgi:hypothetical protein